MARGYSSYRGRKPKWKAFLAVLLVLIILAAVGVMLLQRFIVYDDMGVPRLALPGQAAQQTDDTEPLPGEIDITIEEAEQEETELLQAVQLGDDPASWKETLEGREEAAFCVTMKASGGQLRYPFGVIVEGQVRANTAAVAAEALPQLISDGNYSIARISCLRDGSVARASVESMGLKNTGGYIFYDGNNENWLDPSKEDTRAYLSALAVECAELGFDEILLTDLTYPTVGKLDKIAYRIASDDVTRDTWIAEQIAGFVTAIQTALGDRDVKLSLEVSEAVLENDGVDSIAGINLRDMLLDQLYRVYVPTTEDRAAAFVSGALDNGVLVPELAAVPIASDDQSYLLLNP